MLYYLLLLRFLRDASTGTKRDAFKGTLEERIQLNGGRITVAVSSIAVLRLCMYDILEQSVCIYMYDAYCCCILFRQRV